MSCKHTHCFYGDIIPYTTCAVVGVYVLRQLLLQVRKSSTEHFWRQRAVERREYRDKVSHKALEQYQEPVTPPLGDAHQLILDVVSRRRSYVDALMGCVWRTHKVGRSEDLNAVTEELYDDALEMASLFDAGQFEGLNNKLLLGVPISIKDCIHQKGADSTCGISARCFRHQVQDGLLVNLLKKSGAIPFVRSNVPQLLMMPESENAVWGVTGNPYDAMRTAGGSSGGDGALVATGCSVMGLGSDIGGSIRIPAHYCGVVGFKPTPTLLSKRGVAVPRYKERNGQVIIASTVGPLARSVRDCALMMEVLSSPEARLADPTIPPVEWRRDLVLTGGCRSTPADVNGPKRSLRIAVMYSDNFFEPVPACRRGVQMAANCLKKCGHEVVPFELPVDAGYMVYTYMQLLTADGNWYSYMRALEGEELYKSYKMLQWFTEIPNVLRPALAVLLRSLGEKRKAEMMLRGKCGGLSVREYWETIADMKEIQQAYCNMFVENGYDALLMPGVGITAPKHGMASELLPALSYNFLANILHWPAGTVRKGEDIYDQTTLPLEQRDSFATWASRAVEGSVGLPVGVQVMTPMWQDERCLYIMAEIEREVKFKSTLPGFQ